jgi:hypothetical protein
MREEPEASTLMSPRWLFNDLHSCETYGAREAIRRWRWSMHNGIKVGAVLAVVIVAACSEMGVTSMTTPDSPALVKAPKVTVCHAAGLAGTTHYIAITISENGLNGHFLNNGTPKAGHEEDYIATEESPCNAPEAAYLRICKLSDSDPTAGDLSRVFLFRRDDGPDFELRYLGCTETFAVEPGQRTLTEPYDPNLPAAFSFFAVRVLVTGGGSLISSTGFNATRPASNFEDAVVTVALTSGETTTVTFFNRN